MIKVSRHQLRRYTLERQGLLSRLPPSELFELGVLHSTDYTTPYLSLLGRLEGFTWQLLAQALEAKRYKRQRCMRGTLHLVPEAYQLPITCLYQAGENDSTNEFDQYGISLDEAREVRFFIIEAMQQHGAQSTTSIKKVVDPKYHYKHSNNQRNEITSLAPVMRWMWQLGILELDSRVPNWRSKESTYILATTPPPNCSDLASARNQLIRWYFELYGAAAYEDWVWWTGLKAEVYRPAFEALKPDLVEVQAEGMPEQLWILASQAEALQNTPDAAPEMGRLLPYEDAVLKAYKTTRYRFYDDDGLAEDIAFTKYGEAKPTLWLNGQIIGIWSWNKKAQEPMTVEPFTQLTRAIRKQLNAEVEPVQAFIEASHVLWTS